MKTLILITLLATLVSCKTKTTSRSCTFNGEPVECSQLNSLEDGDTTPPVLTAQVTAAIDVSETEIEILENTYDKKEETVNGKAYSCFIETSVGEVSRYSIANGKLTIMNDNGSAVYTRTQGSGKEIDGTWVMKNIKMEKGYIDLKLTFTKKTMKEVVECHFY